MKIKSIRKLDVEDVYDIIDVEDNNNYIANGFVVHNSSADWNKKDSKELRKKLAEVRTKHLLFILCFPLKIYKMEKNYLECLDGDTLINTEFGKIKIKDLEGKENFKVYSLNEYTNVLELKKAKKCIKTKIDYVYEIITEKKNKILATKDHRFLTDKGWKHVHQISKSDKIKQQDLSYSRIITITRKDKRAVYDILEVEDNHNYIANNNIVHNSFVNYWCVTADTKITTRDKNGMIRSTPIKNLNKYNPEVLSYNTNTKKYEFKKYDKKIKTKKDVEVFELELKNGLKIKCTEDHPFLTQRGWVRLKDLTDYDKIETKTKICKLCKQHFIPKKQQQIYCCKKCNSKSNTNTDRQKEYNKEYREKNKEYCKKLSKKNYIKNRELRLSEAKIYREKNKDKINKYAQEYRKKNVGLLRQRDKEYREKNYDRYIQLHRKNWRKYRENNINFKLRENLRNSMRRVLNSQQTKKTHSIFKYLGCTVEEFKEYISKQFKPGMSWKNWGKYSWHIDHIKPCSHFDLTKESERYKCFNYKNQQPMWASENLSKGDRYVG